MCLRDEVLALRQHGSRPSKRPARRPASAAACFSYPCVLGTREATPFREATAPSRKARIGQYHSRVHLHLHLHLQLHLRLCLHLLRVFPTVAAMYPPIANLRPCSEERDRQVPARGRCKTRKAGQGRAGQVHDVHDATCRAHR